MSDLGLHPFFGDLPHSSTESICLIYKDINYQSIVIGPPIFSLQLSLPRFISLCYVFLALQKKYKIIDCDYYYITH